jgi:hypothetical protein
MRCRLRLDAKSRETGGKVAAAHHGIAGNIGHAQGWTGVARIRWYPGRKKRMWSSL